jgi:SAM-dependent methyltransferase
MKKAISLLFVTILFSFQVHAREAVTANRFQLLSGIRQTKNAERFWDKKYNRSEYIYGKAPAHFLARNVHYIPQGSNVLDMGMGEGRNAVFLARKGLKVLGVDISAVAVKKARRLAREFGVRINTVVASLNKYEIKENSLDAIVCFYYVDRRLTKKMMSWLKPGGVLIYESHTDLQKTVKGSESYERRYLLREGELLNMFDGFRILKYEEPLHQDKFTASVIVQKPR